MPPSSPQGRDRGAPREAMSPIQRSNQNKGLVGAQRVILSIAIITTCVSDRFLAKLTINPLLLRLEIQVLEVTCTGPRDPLQVKSTKQEFFTFLVRPMSQNRKIPPKLQVGRSRSIFFL